MKKLIFAAVTVVALSSGATEWPVSDEASLTNALKNAAANDIVKIAPGTYDLTTCAMSSSTYLTTSEAKPLKIYGTGKTPRATELKGGGTNANHRLLAIYSTTGVVVSNLTFVGGGFQTSSTGGALLCTLTANEDYAIVDSCHFISNAVYGCSTSGGKYVSGGIYASGGAIGLSVPNQDGIPLKAMIIRNCTFDSNCAYTYNKQANGGAVVASFSKVVDCVFTNNYSQNNGGACLDGEHLRNKFLYNTAAGSYTPSSMGGGAIYGWSPLSYPTITDCLFEGNKTTTTYNHGGAIYNANALSNCVFKANRAASNSIVEGCSKLYRCRLENNVSSAILCGGSLFEDCAVISNKCSGFLLSSSSKLVNCLVVSNYCGSSKGILNKSQIYNSTFVGNYCTSGNTSESIVDANCVAVNCLFYGNDVKGGGYDISFYSKDFTPTMTNCRWRAQFYVDNRESISNAAPWKLVNAILDPKSPFGSDQDRSWALAKNSAARDCGYLDDNVRALVGDRDLAEDYRISGRAIDLGCYEYQAPGFFLLIR